MRALYEPSQELSIVVQESSNSCPVGRDSAKNWSSVANIGQTWPKATRAGETHWKCNANGPKFGQLLPTWPMIGLKRPEPDRLTRTAIRMRQWVGVKQDKYRTRSPGFSWTITRPSNQYNMRPNSGHLPMGGLGLKGLVESLPTLVDIRHRHLLDM